MGMLADKFYTPDGRVVDVCSNLGVLFSDDFGGTSIDTTKWQVLAGGQGAVTLPNGTVQAAIGTGVSSGMSGAVSGSALTITMGTATTAELWYLSNQTFGCSEDILVVLSKSAFVTTNSVFIGLVEVNSAGQALLNPNVTKEFTNRGGVEFANTVTTTAYNCQAVADSSSTVAQGSIGVAAAALSTTQEFAIEFQSEDVICTTQAVDTLGGRIATGSRVSTQCPNDNKRYKLLMRFRNTAASSACSIVIQRILVVDRQEMRVEVTSGRGDTNPQKAIAVNIASAVSGAGLTPVPSATPSASTTSFRLSSAATTNSNSVKGSQGTLYGGQVTNTGTTAAYLKLYNKATAPTVGTDTPVITLLLPAVVASTDAVPVNIADVLGGNGYNFPLGIGLAITGAYADADTTAVAAGQVISNLFYA